jgi:hypothetical protein
MKKIFYLGKKKVGWLEDKIFRKVVYGSRHLFKKSDSWGIDYDLLKKLPDDGEIRILDKETEIIYIAPVARMRRGAVMRFKNDSGDWGAQVFLPRGWFSVIKDGVRTDNEVGEGQDEMEKVFNALPDFPKKGLSTSQS